MPNNTEVTVHQETAIEKPADLLTIINSVVAGPLDLQKVEVLERLLAMQERVQAQQREQAFIDAMARLQPILPQIEKNGEIIVKGVLRSRYSRYEDIDAVIRPLYSNEGFAVSFNSDSKDGKLFTLSIKVSHREGHSETKSLVLPIDSNDYRSAVQNIGSTVSYGRRQLLKMAFNIIEKGEDTDGENLEPISKEDVLELTTMIKDTNANLGGFLKYMGVDRLEDIRQKDRQKAFTAMDDKRRSQVKK